MDTFGARLAHVARGAVSIETPIGANALQQHGFGHAGLTFTIGDSAAGYAALSVLPEGAEVMTAEMKINLLSPARGQALRASGTVIRAGRRLVVVSARVCALEKGHETDVALLQGTMVPL